MTELDFSSDPDPVLGRLLREHLTPGDHAGFVHRVLEQLEQVDTSWDVLGRWARPGVAAVFAFLLGAAAWFLLRAGTEPVTMVDALRPGDAPASLFSGSQPDNEVLLQVVLER